MTDCLLATLRLGYRRGLMKRYCNDQYRGPASLTSRSRRDSGNGDPYVHIFMRVVSARLGHSCGGLPRPRRKSL